MLCTNVHVRKHSFKVIASVLSVMVLFTMFSNNALAYNGGAAAAYADKWARVSNGAWPSYGNDCTNFLSQSLLAGGDGMNLTWYAYNNPITGWSHTVSLAWDNANSNFNYETQQNGGIVTYKVNASNSQYFDHFDGISAGDMLYFDWGRGEGLSHAAIQVNTGTSHYDNNWTGDLSDQHSPYRLHVSWNHIEVNADWGTTTIWEVSHG
jgi:hypothetical protein